MAQSFFCWFVSVLDILFPPLLQHKVRLRFALKIIGLQTLCAVL
nr:MAG TPA: hypothetical protein [Caudoviricetes sp.]